LREKEVVSESLARRQHVLCVRQQLAVAHSASKKADGAEAEQCLRRGFARERQNLL
jgi:hypothetical protein